MERAHQIEEKACELWQSTHEILSVKKAVWERSWYNNQHKIFAIVYLYVPKTLSLLTYIGSIIFIGAVNLFPSSRAVNMLRKLLDDDDNYYYHHYSLRYTWLLGVRGGRDRYVWLRNFIVRSMYLHLYQYCSQLNYTWISVLEYTLKVSVQINEFISHINSIILSLYIYYQWKFTFAFTESTNSTVGSTFESATITTPSFEFPMWGPMFEYPWIHICTNILLLSLKLQHNLTYYMSTILTYIWVEINLVFIYMGEGSSYTDCKTKNFYTSTITFSQIHNSTIYPLD